MQITLGDLKDYQPIITIIIGVFAAIVAISLAYFVNWRRLHKSISYSTLTNTNLVKISDELKDDVQIFYKKKPVTNVRLFIIKVVNDGKVPIEKKDFDKDFEFVFDMQTQILSSEIVARKPDNLEVLFATTSNRISIKPLLLNSKDEFQIKILAWNADKYKCDARISGIGKIEERDFRASTNSSILNRFYPIFVFGIAWLLLIPTIRTFGEALVIGALAGGVIAIYTLGRKLK